MDLRKVLNGVQKHVSEAYNELLDGHETQAKDCLADAAGLIQREIGDDDAVNEEKAEKEETPQTPGHCQPDQTHEAGS